MTGRYLIQYWLESDHQVAPPHNLHHVVNAASGQSVSPKNGVGFPGREG